MRVLVTGGCGFIGSHLCEALLNRGDQVVVVDDLSTGLRENIPDVVTFIKGDVTDSALIAEIMPDIDACFHLAAIASVVQCAEQWYESHCTNQSGLVNILDKARQEKLIPVVYASSAAVYGDSKELPLKEDTPLHQISLYGIDKYLCEVQAKAAGEIYGLPTMGMRFFNVFGSRQVPDSPYSGVISKFIYNSLNKIPIEIFGDGGQIRDFIYVKDVVEGMLLAMDNASPYGPIANICTGDQTTILDLAKIIMGLCDYSEDIVFGPPREGDIYESIGSPEQAIKLFSFEAKTNISNGLVETIKSMKD